MRGYVCNSVFIELIGQAFAYRNIQESNRITHLIDRFLGISMLKSIKKARTEAQSG